MFRLLSAITLSQNIPSPCLLFGETWQSFCKHDFQSLDSCLLFRYFSSHPDQSKMFCKWKDLAALWKFEMSAPENACHQLSQIRQTSRLQGILFFLFYFVFRMYSFHNMVCATEMYLLSSISVVRQFSENIFFYKHTFVFIFQFKLEKYSEKNKKSLQLW